MTDNFRKRSLAAPIYLPSLLITGAEGALLPILPVTAVSYGFSLAEAGIVAAVLMIGTLVFEVPASYLTNRIGERSTMLIGAGLGVIAGVLAFLNLGYFSLLVAALLFGAGHAYFGLARHSVLAELVPAEHRPKSMSLLGGMFRGGMAIGPIISSAFIALYGVQSGYLPWWQRKTSGKKVCETASYLGGCFSHHQRWQNDSNGWFATISYRTCA